MSTEMIPENYFQSYEKYFWQWEENMEVVAIPASNTIAYSEQIIDIFDKLTPQGVPPFGSLLLVIIATNEKGSTMLDVVNSIMFDVVKAKELPVLSEAIAFLKLLSEVPGQYKQGKNRILLFQAIFERCHNSTSVENAIEIKTGFQSHMHGKQTTAAKKEFNNLVFAKDFRTIALLKNRYHSVNEILKKIASLPDLADVQLESNDLAGSDNESIDLIEQLIEHPKTSHIGSLVRRIWGGLNIPVHSALPSEQPLGGVSDLSNKGDFNKLLISEFANDDIVFMSRLANNEALYIHREIPPATNHLKRVILIDVSLKTWGTPKAIAFATMLAIAKHPKTNIDCTAYVVGNTYHPVSFESIHTLIEGLQLLEGSLHAASGLETFFKDNPVSNNSEHFLITTQTTLKQVAMLKAMNEYHAFINYCIYTDADGNIDIYKKQQNSKKHIQHIRLPLEELWKKDIHKTNKTDTTSEQAADYPLLFRNNSRKKQFLSTSDGEIFQITGDRCLLRFYNPSETQYNKGWEMMYENLPFFGGTFEMGLLSIGERVLLMFNPQSREITLLNIDTHSKTSFLFDEWEATKHRDFIFENDRFYHLNDKGTFSIGLNGERELSSAPELSAFEDQSKKIFEILKNHSFNSGVFKNVREVFINETNNLVLNIHELHINKGYHIKLDTSAFRAQTIKAVKHSESEFIFKDGSIVEINRAGMLILKSSNTNIPWIYIPLAIDSSLGVATETDFAGNYFFQKDPLFEVRLVATGTQNISLTKVLREHLPLGLADAKRMVDSAPVLVHRSLNEAKATELKTALQNAEGVVVLKQVNKGTGGYTSMNKISPVTFFKNYIEPFIQTIQSYGTKD